MLNPAGLLLLEFLNELDTGLSDLRQAVGELANLDLPPPYVDFESFDRELGRLEASRADLLERAADLP